MRRSLVKSVIQIPVFLATRKTLVTLGTLALVCSYRFMASVSILWPPPLLTLVIVGRHDLKFCVDGGEKPLQKFKALFSAGSNTPVAGPYLRSQANHDFIWAVQGCNRLVPTSAGLLSRGQQPSVLTWFVEPTRLQMPLVKCA